MRATKGRKLKTSKAGSKKGVESPDDRSAIDLASFIEGLQQGPDNPLHSTAVEEDLNFAEGQKKAETAGGIDIPKNSKTFVKQHGADIKRKKTKKDAENRKEDDKKKSTRGNAEVKPENEAVQNKKSQVSKGQTQDLKAEGEEPDADPITSGSNLPTPSTSGVRRLVGKKPTKRSAVQTSAAKKEKKQQVKKVKKRERKLESVKSSDPQVQEKYDTSAVLFSDEDVTDEDMSWTPSPKKAKVYGLGRDRKSSSGSSKSRPSSGSASDVPAKVDTGKLKGKKQGRQGRTELEVVLDSFTDFCDQYRESVESKAVSQSAESFLAHVKQQLMERISSDKEVRYLTRQNVKVVSLIHKKRQHLMNAKYERMRAERQLSKLKKEEAELKLRLTDLRQGQAFLHDLRVLNVQYLKFRRKHPKKKETYGASSLPALQLERKKLRRQ